jgi:hypothetical protein
MLSKFARAAHQCIRPEGGGYRRDHFRARPAGRGRRGRGFHYRIKIPAASGACGEWRGERSVHSGTELAEREGFEPSIELYNPITV